MKPVVKPDLKKVPKVSWQFVRDKIHERMLIRHYLPGQKLPKDSDFAEEFGCARLTIQRAMNDLAENGLVERRRKGGTRVSLHPVTRATVEIPLTKAVIEDRGMRYGYHLLLREILPPPPHIAQSSGSNLKMLHLQSIFFADEKPYVYEDRWTSIQTIPTILDVDFTLISANQWLVENQPYSHCDVNIYALRAEEIAPHLSCDPYDAILALSRTTWIHGAHITSVRSYHAPGYVLASSADRTI